MRLHIDVCLEYLFTARHTCMHQSIASHPWPQCLLWPSIRPRGPGIKQDVRVTTSVIHTARHSCPNSSVERRLQGTHTHTHTQTFRRFYAGQKFLGMKKELLIAHLRVEEETENPQTALKTKETTSHLSVFWHPHATSLLSPFFQLPSLKVKGSDKHYSTPPSWVLRPKTAPP